jgi:hypothetical protein
VSELPPPQPDTAPLLVFAANANAETLSEARREHKAQLALLHREIALLKRDVETSRADVATLRREKAFLRGTVDDFARAVVTIDGTNVTLWSLFEAGKYRELCSCRDVDCDGCPDAEDAPDVEVFDAR